MSYDLIVDEDYISRASSNILSDFEKLDGIFEKYISILEEIKTSAIKEGATAQALGAFMEYASLLRDNLTGLGLNAKDLLKDFNSAIDEADEYLF